MQPKKNDKATHSRMFVDKDGKLKCHLPALGVSGEFSCMTDAPDGKVKMFFSTTTP